MAVKKTFAFKLEDMVKLDQSNEVGVIVGRAHYVDSNPTYYIRYKAADGRLIESWWNESALSAHIGPA
jgi:hypothetical protein